MVFKGVITALIFFVFCLKATAAVVINEVCFNPVGSDSGQEWIELYNNGVEAINLKGYELYPDGIGYFSFPDFTLAPDKYVVVRLRQDGIDTATDLFFPAPTSNMSNSSGSIALFNTSMHSTSTIIDFVQYGSSGQTWEATAVSAGIWQKTTTIVTPLEGESFGLKNNGFDANKREDWATFSKPTPAAGNQPGAEVENLTVNFIKAKITEVSPGAGSDGYDWIELYFIDTAGGIGGCKLYADKYLLKSLPEITPQPGDYLILHLNDSLHLSENNSTGKGDNNVWDIYSPGVENTGQSEGDGGLTNTDVVVSLKDSDSTSWSNGNIVDVLVFAKDTWSGDDDCLNLVVSSGCWIGEPVSWSGSQTESISRQVFNNLPSDSDKNSDWMLKYPSLGQGYGSREFATTTNLEIFQSPFSPFGDGQYQEAVISVNVPDASEVSLKVFDISGYLIKTLLNQERALGEKIILTWDGKNDEGNIVPVGIYVVYLEAVNRNNGEVKRAAKTVIVACEL